MKKKTFLLLTLLFITSILTFVQKSHAQYLPDCYTRKLKNPDIVCSLCGTSYEESESVCEERTQTSTSPEVWYYDQSICMCVPSSDTGNCHGDIVDRRNDCYDKGGFWAEAYCTCYLEGKFTPVVADDFIENVKDTIFFKTNFDGSIDNVAELIRMGFIIAFAVISVISAVIGFYGMGLYSTAGEKDEQVQKAQAVLKNGIIGVAVSIFGIAIVQLIGMAMGIADSITDTSFNLSNVAP